MKKAAAKKQAAAPEADLVVPAGGKPTVTVTKAPGRVRQAWGRLSGRYKLLLVALAIVLLVLLVVLLLATTNRPAKKTGTSTKETDPVGVVVNDANATPASDETKEIKQEVKKELEKSGVSAALQTVSQTIADVSISKAEKEAAIGQLSTSCAAQKDKQCLDSLVAEAVKYEVSPFGPALQLHRLYILNGDNQMAAQLSAEMKRYQSSFPNEYGLFIELIDPNYSGGAL